MFKALLLSRLQCLLSSFYSNARKKNKSKAMPILMAVLFAYVFIVFTGMFTAFFSELCEPFHLMEIDWFYFTLAALFSFCIMFFFSIFATYSQLYEAKDNELLLSMPIPSHYILASRMVSLLIVNFVLEIMVICPAAVIYALRVGFSPIGVVALLLVALALPFLALAISSVFGYLIALVVSRVRNKTAVSLFMSLSFLAVYFYVYSKMSSYILTLITNGAQIAEKISPIYPVYMIGNSVASGNILEAILTVVMALVPFAIAYAILSLSFVKLATKKAGAKKKKAYTKEAIREGSVGLALFKKELSHYLASAGYMLNSSMGVIFQVAAAVFVIVKAKEIGEILSFLPETLPIAPIVMLLAVLLSSTNIITAPSVSIDAKIIWITHSMPIPPFEVLRAKLRLALAITVIPTALLPIISIFVLPVTILDGIVALLGALAFCVFVALFGLFVNIYLPKFDWTSETMAVKQGISTLVAMFAPFIIIVPICIVAYTTEAYTLIAYAFRDIIVILDILLYSWLPTKGAEKYSRLVGA